MLIQLIYRSLSSLSFSAEELTQFGRELSAKNQNLQVSGYLLYDGAYFLQVLEGEESSVDRIYSAVCKDLRHRNIVLLLRDPIPRTHFDGFRMDTLDVRCVQGTSANNSLTILGSAMTSGWNSDRRSERIIEAFIGGRWRDAVPALAWSMDYEQAKVSRTTVKPAALKAAAIPATQTRFALQPIVHPLSQRVTSVEALLRGPLGESPQSVLAAIAPDRLHEFDLHSKGDAIALAAALQLDCILCVNLLPMSMVSNAHAVDYLVGQCEKYGWPLDHLLVEVTEEEAITHLDDFLGAVQKLRASGIQVAIDDFGAGHAGLSLLADFQPDKLKLDKRIVQNVCSSGPRQAIVRSVVEFCFCLGITVVAEGVETIDDWLWLQSAGIKRFQGYLFARPLIQGMPEVCWPAGVD